MNLMAASIVIVTEKDPAAVREILDGVLNALTPGMRAAIVDFHPAMKLVSASQARLLQIKLAEDFLVEDLTKLLSKN